MNLLGRREPSRSVVFLIKPVFEGIVEKGSARERAGNRESSQTTAGGSRKELQFAKSVVAEK